MRVNPGILLSDLQSAEAPRRMAAIRRLQEDLSDGPPDLTPAIIDALDRVASFDSNHHLRVEAGRLLARDEYLDLYDRLAIPLPASLRHQPGGSESQAEAAKAASSAQPPEPLSRRLRSALLLGAAVALIAAILSAVFHLIVADPGWSGWWMSNLLFFLLLSLALPRVFLPHGGIFTYVALFALGWFGAAFLARLLLPKRQALLVLGLLYAIVGCGLLCALAATHWLF